MSTDAERVDPAPAAPIERRPSRARLILKRVALGLMLYVAVAYLALPFAWEWYAHDHPRFDDSPRLTKTHDGHPGDPLNVALVGSREDIERVMAAAKWYAAAPLGFRSDLKIAADTVLKRAYDQAPVSRLYLFGRKEDLAYEQPVGKDPRQRNHVRLWKMDETTADGRQKWIGAASYDERVGLSRTTGQITHHIAPEVDQERDHLFADLEETGLLEDRQVVPGFHQTLEGRNGGGDPWRTDGALWVGVIKASRPQD
ncbi:hypothetical protein KOR34_51510 [Posidoniimonas corsicana]|uniref:LssY-like C-terminal domain-containing protein n=1 Tax=Posidoniimonas corsicana TaxID=1938618 RepID=A0A5C5UVN4_9BACT|nr:LssY C-terminal domain-containing protein [Posidoniimonas corsicana]TWT29597.1 hypothetical protein KOR34_51510 [Posidoniimonas corsicana]